MARILICLVAIYGSSVSFAIPKSQMWTGAVCSALFRKPQIEASTHAVFALEKFRRKLNPFDPDIRQSEGFEWESSPEDEENKPRVVVKFGQNTPALNTFSMLSHSEPTKEQSLAISQRAFGVEYDMHQSKNTLLTYGFMLRGETEIREYLERIEKAIEEKSPMAQKYTSRAVPFWRKTNLPSSILVPIGALGVIATFPFTAADPIAFARFTFYTSLFAGLSYLTVGQEIAHYWKKFVKGAPRTHMVSYKKHYEFIKDQINSPHPAAWSYYAQNLQLHPDLTAALKEIDRTEKNLDEGMCEQCVLDRGSWIDGFVKSLKSKGPIDLIIPRGPTKEAGLDEVFYYDPETKEPVYIFFGRFFNEYPKYPKKLKEIKELMKEWGWINAS